MTRHLTSGAVTWGQFFIYQGFNERIGWMHTSTGADAFDEYAETILEKPNGFFYRHGTEERPVLASPVTIRYRTEGGTGERKFTVYRTHHGPVVREADGTWITLRLMQEPVKALTQSYLRTKASGYDAFKQIMELHTNSSNNTVYADADGNIAYFHANFIPRRSRKFDWTRPVDGSDPATEWQGVHAVDESPNVKNPANGWIQNTNNWPYSVAGPNSPKAGDFPPYMDQVGENPRGVHAIRVLSGRSGFTLESLIAAAYDSSLTAFDDLLPPLLDAYRAEPAASPLKAGVAEQIALLEAWDHRSSVESVATTLAVYWAEELRRRGSPAQRLEALAAASAKLSRDFGTWKTPWGEVNRLQRLTGAIVQPFNDAAPSIPIGFTSGEWGSLAAFEARSYPGTRRMYGTGGNSFVAAVELGKTVRARAITVGGQSGDPESPHFSDQAGRYAQGALRDVYFYRPDLEKHTVRRYNPGR